jgi:hypothetical protein
MRAGLTKKYAAGSDLAGLPARSRAQVLRLQAALHRLPGALERMDRL